MQVAVLYHPNSEHEGKVLDYVHEYQTRNPGVVFKMLSLEKPEGADMAKLYDVTSYPAFLVLTDDGQLEQIWQEEYLPPMKELDFYTLPQ